ncbi:hypothetical protein GCM10027168_06970 [Streptomyces capparidis]
MTTPAPVALLYDRQISGSGTVIARLTALDHHARAQGWDRAGAWVDCGTPARTPHLRPRLYDALKEVPRLRWAPVLLLIHTEDRLCTHPLWAARLADTIRWTGAHLQILMPDRPPPSPRP